MVQWRLNLVRTQRYKKLERQIALTAGTLFGYIARGLSAILSFFDRKITVMIVPHSNNKVVTLQTNMFAMFFGMTLIAGILSSFLYFNKNAIKANAEISDLLNSNKQTQASLDELRDENNNLLQTAKRFQSALSQSLSLLGINASSSSQAPAKTSDLSSVFSTEDTAIGSVKETADIRQVIEYLDNAIQPIQRMTMFLETQGALFSDIPSVWPLQGGVGHISMSFGQNINPFNGQWYIHKGLDISTYRSGDPIITTANGQVVTIGYDGSGYGNYVIIKHKHGVYTRYAHMSSVYAKKGQFVSQGEVIGAIGATGVVTGPHLHYEVHVGADVVDPLKYVNGK